MATIPTARFGHTLVYTNYTPDGVLHASPASITINTSTGTILSDYIPYIMVLFGGWSGVNTTQAFNLNDTWEYHDGQWSSITTVSAPAARGGYAACWDGTGVLLFGGYNAATPTDYGDVWRYIPGTGGGWTQLATSGGPSGNRNGVLFNANGTVYYFGGHTSTPTYKNELWRWNPGTNDWSLIATTNTPSARAFHAIAYDADHGDVILYGGYNGSALNDTYTLNLSTFVWTTQSPAHTPGARYGMGFAYTGGELSGGTSGSPGLLIIGGTSTGTTSILQEAWVWGRDDWRQLQFAIPRARAFCGAIPQYIIGDTVSGGAGSYSITYSDYHNLLGGNQYGGLNFSAAMDDFWVHTQIPSDPIPGISGIHYFCDGPWSVINNQFLGYNGSPSTTPVAVFNGGLAYYGGGGNVNTNPFILTFGGFKGTGLSGDGADELWMFDLTKGTWTRLTAATPPGKAEFGMRLDSNSNKIILFGGTDGSSRSSDTWLFDPYYGWWIKVNVASSPSARSIFNSLKYDSNRNRLMFFGGYTGSAALQDMYYFDYTNLTWTSISTSGQPSIRYNFGCSFDTSRNKYIVFGGTNGTSKFLDTWEWDSAAQTWSNPTPAHSPPDGNTFRMDYYPGVGTIGFGGFTSTGESAFSQETWKWDGTDWTDMAKGAFIPSARYCQMMLYSSTGNLLYMYAGGTTRSNPYAPTNDLLVFNGTYWQTGFSNSNLIITNYEILSSDFLNSKVNNLIGSSTTKFSPGSHRGLNGFKD